MNLKFGSLNIIWDVCYDSSIDYIRLDPDDIFSIIDSRWFNFLVFCCGGEYIYRTKDLIHFGSSNSKNHFVYLISKYYPILTLSNNANYELTIKKNNE